MAAHNLGTGIDHIGEDARRAAEDIILQLDAGVERDVVLDLDVVADHNVAGHEHVLPERAVRANRGMRHHVAEMPDAGSFSNMARRIHVRAGMDEEGMVAHGRWVGGGPYAVQVGMRVGRAQAVAQKADLARGYRRHRKGRQRTLRS